MSARTTDLFGGQPLAEAATAGSYGEAPSGHRLPASTRLGAVKLLVSDLTRSIAFYEKTLGLRVLASDGTNAWLAAHGADTPLVVLEARAGTRRAGEAGRLGLYHFAILLPDRASLGRFVRHLSEIGARAGAGDHLVSEALYLQDPDNLGIEVYADRPRESWRRMGRELLMATDPVDMAGLAQSAGHERWKGLPAGTVMGHVHLHVGDLTQASAFYSEALGFDRMVWRYPGALFLAAGGYHHHLGTNIWAGAGARAPQEDEAQLLEWTIEVPSPGDAEGAVRSLEGAGHSISRDPDGSALARDPWGTAVRMRALPTGSPHS
jgi:catechol 2,3-dioxygenase